MKRKSILYLTHRVPCPPNRGDRIRTYNILRYLAERADVSLVCLSEEPVDTSTRTALANWCQKVQVVPVQPRLRWIRAGLSFLRGRSISEGAFTSPELQAAIGRVAEGRPFDAVLTSSSVFAKALKHDALNGVPAWVDLIDVDSQKWIDYAEAHHGPKSWLYSREGQRLRSLETSLEKSSQGLFVVSENEAEIFRRFCPTDKIRAIGNGVDVDYFAPQEIESRADCVFVGALDYLPNVDAAVWFGREVWPMLRALRPESRFQIVGRAPTKAIRDLAAIDGIDVVGTVPDVRPYVAAAQAVVVPLRIARGVQNKILEAMAMGKAVVSSPRPLQGLPLQPGVHCLTAETHDEWRDAVLNLWEQPVLRSAIGTAAWSYTQTHHRWSACLRPLGELLELESATNEKVVTVGDAAVPSNR